MTERIIYNGDHAEYEAENANVKPEDRSDWPLPSFHAQDWARAFCRINTASDEGTMLGWFANALMRGFDEGVARSGKRDRRAIQRTENDLSEARAENAALREQLRRTNHDWMTATRDAAGLEEEIAALKAERSMLSDENLKKAQAIIAAHAECREIESGLREAPAIRIDENAALRAENKRLRAANTQRTKEIQSLNVGMERLRERVAELEDAIYTRCRWYGPMMPIAEEIERRRR